MAVSDSALCTATGSDDIDDEELSRSMQESPLPVESVKNAAPDVSLRREDSQPLFPQPLSAQEEEDFTKDMTEPERLRSPSSSSGPGLSTETMIQGPFWNPVASPPPAIRKQGGHNSHASSPGAEALSVVTNRWAKDFRAGLENLAQKCNELERECALVNVSCADKDHPGEGSINGAQVQSLAERHAKLMGDMRDLLSQEIQEGEESKLKTDADCEWNSNQSKLDSSFTVKPLNLSLDGEKLLPGLQEEVAMLLRQGSFTKEADDQALQSPKAPAGTHRSVVPEAQAMKASKDEVVEAMKSIDTLIGAVGNAKRNAELPSFNLAQRGVPTPCRQPALRVPNDSAESCDNGKQTTASSRSNVSCQKPGDQSPHKKKSVPVESSSPQARLDLKVGATMDRLECIKHNAQAVFAARRALSAERNSENRSPGSWSAATTPTARGKKVDLNASLEDKAISNVWSKYHPSRSKNTSMIGSLPEPPSPNRSRRLSPSSSRQLSRSSGRSLTPDSLRSSEHAASTPGTRASTPGARRQRSAPAESREPKPNERTPSDKLKDTAISTVWAKYHTSRGGEAPSWWGSSESGFVGSGSQTPLQSTEQSFVVGPSTLPPPPSTPSSGPVFAMPPPGTPGGHVMPQGSYIPHNSTGPAGMMVGSFGLGVPPGPGSLPPPFSMQAPPGVIVSTGVSIPPLPLPVHGGIPGNAPQGPWPPQQQPQQPMTGLVRVPSVRLG
eukprot:gnl/MRDRNA2_/MRDRNA2_75883_c0_seq2.p1 gnl/MRDRNA2_/MRDRNA2_75883_c0~~gnl/MRDRNA2_/MRDRNA2_75883_c0_seq2.p1  ORF type:complete len:725 (+),score=127.66 gnl/MRDRNA2_/MRDRNA2_75883_c0_seq2:116-2290(+)